MDKLVKTCIEKNEYDNLKEMLLSNPSLLHDVDLNGNGLLHLVAQQNNIDSGFGAQILIEFGLDVNMINKNFETALDIAIKNNNIQLIAILKEYHKNI